MLSAPQLRNPNAQSFTHAELQRAMLETIASLNQFGEEAGVSEVCARKIE
jgi:glutamine amidotransferase